MYEQMTPESIQAGILDNVSAFDTREGSFARTLIAPAAYEIWKYYTALESVTYMIFPDETSGEYIDRKCADYGITRKPGASATAPITLTGEAGTVAPVGKIFLTPDGLRYTLDQAVTIPAGGEAAGTLTAEAEGGAYNADAGEISIQQTPLSGLTAFSAGAATGGLDPETDKQLCGRLYDHLQKPATSGNVHQYREWALSVPGVGDARIFPLWNGNGTVKVVICDPDYGVAPTETVTACAAYIETVRPVGATVTVESAAEKEITVSVTAVLDSSTTAAEVQRRFETAIRAYLREIAFRKASVVYARIGFLLLDIDGVQDYADLLLNGGTENVALAETEIPALKEVTVHV